MTSTDEASKLAAIERSEGWKTMMSTHQARRVMWERFEVFGIYQASGNMNPQALAYAEGRRALALQVMNDLLSEVPELYDRMVQENRDRLRRENTNVENDE